MTVDLGEFFTEHRRMLFRRFYWLTRNMAEADDLVQETFCQLWAKGPTLEADNPITFVLTVGRRIYISRVRGAVFGERMVESYVRYSSKVVDIERDYGNRELARRAVDEIVDLAPKPRRVMLLKVWYEARDGKPNRRDGRNAEVAKVLGMRTNTVLQHVCQSRRRVAAALL